MQIPGLGVVLGTIIGVILSKYEIATLVALAAILIVFGVYKQAVFPAMLSK